MMPKKEEVKVWILGSFVERGKIPTEEDAETKGRTESKGKDHPETTPMQLSILYAVTKPRQYCGCPQVLADWSQI